MVGTYVEAFMTLVAGPSFVFDVLVIDSILFLDFTLILAPFETTHHSIALSVVVY